MNKNRFFADENSSSSDDEQQIEDRKTKPAAKWYLDSSDSDKENVQRIVRSEKDKRYEEIKEVIKRIEQAVRIRDINRVYEGFESLSKAYDKARRIIQNEQKIPRFYIKILVQLDDFVNQCWSDETRRDALNKHDSTNLNTLRQKLRRYLKQRSFEKEINAYRERPSDEVSEIDEAATQENNTYESFSTESDDTDVPIVEPYEQFLKDRIVQNKNPSHTGRSSGKPKPSVSSFDQKSLQNTVVIDEVDTDLKKEEITEQVILIKLNEVISKRGKRGINYQDQFECLKILQEHVEQQNFDVEIKIQILLIQITLCFDYNHQGNEYSKVDIWTRSLDYIDELLILLSENGCLKDEMLCNIYDDIITIILQMDEEFSKMLQNTDAHSQDYVERLKDEVRICSIIDRFKIYLESKYNTDNTISQYLCTIYLCVIEHIYYKYDKTIDQSSITLIDRLCKFIYTNDTLDHIRDRGNLCRIYHLALHDHYHEARDLILMSHMQDRIPSFDITTQILYNRTMVQLGLCAFRFGAIHEAHQILVDFQSGNRVKELLGQSHQDMKEQEYLLPFHMHINIQLIECIYLISAMLIEIPIRKKHRISKHFHILMCQAGKQAVFGPPETMREYIVAATHAMKTGDWNACVRYLINEEMNKKVWNLIPKATVMFEMLINKIKEESLRVYLLNYATVFNTISITTLVDMFELPNKQIYRIICKMIINKELMGSIDESNQMVVIHETNSTGVQGLPDELMGKVFTLYEHNEKLSRFQSRTINNYV